MSKKPTYAELLQIVDMVGEAEYLAKLGSFKQNIKDDIVFWSKGLYTILGFDPSLPPPDYATFSNRIHQDDKKNVDLIVERAFTTGESAITFYRYFMPNGQIKYISARAQVTTDADGNPVNLIGTIQDVTQFVLNVHKLKKSEQKYRQLVNTLQEGIWAVDEQNRTTFLNHQMANMLGYTIAEMMGKELMSFMEESSAEIMKYNLALREKGFLEQRDFEFRHRNGDRIYTTMAVGPIIDEHGQYRGALAGIIDISKRKRIEEQLLQSQKMEALGTLAGGIAHDFNNLLTPILGYSQLAKSGTSLGRKEIDYLDNIEMSAHRAKKLVQKILLVSRNPTTTIESVQLKTLVEEVLTILQASIPANIQIRQENDFDLPFIAADPSQIYQVILNLCTNAVQAMPHGGVLSIKLNNITQQHIEKNKPYIRSFVSLTVQDTGYGMDSATLARMYEPFFTTKEKGEQRGTGLGLSIVSNVIEQHKGRIEVQSELGVGTSFRICFPIIEVENVHLPRESEIGNSSIEVRNKHILFIDDEKIVCDLGATILRELGYQVTSYTNSQNALDDFAANSKNFQLVITDYSMPHLSGPELIQKIKSICPDIPLLLVTGYSNLKLLENLEELECDGIITKPYDVHVLRQTIGKILAKDES